MEHTREKWKVADTSPWINDPYVIISDDKEIARTSSGEPEDHANAKLMAAAPDLLKACELLADVAQGSVEYSDWPELQKAVNKAHKAIEKATTPPPVG